MERMTFWSRVGDWFKNPRRSMGWELSNRDPAQPAQVEPYVVGNGKGHPETGYGQKRPWLGFGGHRRTLEDQSRQLADLLRSIQGHAQRQTQVAESAGANLERVVASLATLPAIVQSQHEEMAALRKQLELLPGSQKHIQEILGQLSGIRESAREGTATLARISESSQKSNETIASELQRQNQAVTQLVQTADPMMRAVTALRADVGSRGQELGQCIADLNRKLTQFAITAVILAVVAAIIGVAAFFR